jgi:hypothetical protein
MAWTYDGIRIYPQDLEQTKKQIIARLQPLNAGTVLQTFGWENSVFQINCKVVGDTNLDALVADLEDGTKHTLAGNDGFSESVYLSSLNAKRDLFAWQTIDTSQDCTTPVYSVTLEFYK